MLKLFTVRSQLPDPEGALTYRTIQFSKSSGCCHPKTPLESRIPFRGQKSRAPNLLPLLGISGFEFLKRGQTTKAAADCQHGYFFVVQPFLSLSEGTPLEYQHRLNPQEFSSKKIVPISRGIQQGFPPPRTDRSGTKSVSLAFFETDQLRQQLAAITSNKNSTPAHPDCCCGREWRKTDVCMSRFRR